MGSFIFLCKINNKYLFVSRYVCRYSQGLILSHSQEDGWRSEFLLDESIRNSDLAEGHPEGPAPHLEALDVEHGGLVLRQQQHDVLPGQEPLETHLRLQVRPEIIKQTLARRNKKKIKLVLKIKCCKCSYDLK